jgi:hypothetical protein
VIVTAKVFGSHYPRFGDYTINALKQGIYGQFFERGVDLDGNGEAQFRDL